MTRIKIEKPLVKTEKELSKEFKMEIGEKMKAYNPKLSNSSEILDSMAQTTLSSISKRFEKYFIDSRKNVKIYETYSVALEAAGFVQNSSIAARVDCTVLVEQCERFLQMQLKEKIVE